MSGMSAIVMTKGVIRAPSATRRSGTASRRGGHGRTLSSSRTTASRDDDDAATGFVNIKGDEGVDEARTEVPQSIKDQYRLIEDPTWLERELLRQDDGYPTSRAAVLRQTFMTGDAKGFGYAVSSIQLTLAMFACAYVAFAAARVLTATKAYPIPLGSVNATAGLSPCDRGALTTRPNGSDEATEGN